MVSETVSKNRDFQEIQFKTPVLLLAFPTEVNPDNLNNEKCPIGHWGTFMRAEDGGNEAFKEVRINMGMKLNNFLLQCLAGRG